MIFNGNFQEAENCFRVGKQIDDFFEIKKLFLGGKKVRIRYYISYSNMWDKSSLYLFKDT